MEFKKVSDERPTPEPHARVIIYTGESEFAGEQYFDVEAYTLWPEYYEFPEDQPEVSAAATHWAKRPFD